ncbi:MAG: V-type ATP synthase subunit B [Oscillospiraceae bacterium]|nr:V-type ATP synthase subunit B [Oscillospiraceae bacterium]
MILKYTGLSKINGPIVAVKAASTVSFDELAEIELSNGEKRLGNVIYIDEEICLVQVFEGTSGISSYNTKTRFLGEALKIELSPEILGRIFDGVGRPIDELGKINGDVKRDINGRPINPVARKYPRDYIETGISTIDGLITLIRGQKLPIFSANGLPHDELAEQIIRQANIKNSEKFAIVFGIMGIEYETAAFFRQSFENNGVLDRVVMFQNLSVDPIVERVLTPRVALTAAEYLAFDLGYHVLVILSDMTSYAESLREISSLKDEIPSRKGYPGYLYSDLASIYERAGMIKDKEGSITQIPILTMPNDDISHPIPDLTGYITEGQIVLDRELHAKSIYPPIGILPSLSRLAKDGIGKGFTREDHANIASQLFSSYSKVQEARSLASVIGEEDLSDLDKQYVQFGRKFEEEFVSQGKDRKRGINETLDLALEILNTLPKEELDRLGGTD